MNAGKQRYFIRKSIAIIGFMGSGKTSVADLLSKHTGIEAVDTDKKIVQVEQQTVSEIINTRGEAEFRKIEAKVLGDLVEGKKMIISTGGGCIESAVSRGILKDCYTIWLKVDAKNAEERIEDFAQRPMFKDLANAKNILAERNEIYEQYSDVAVNTNNKNLTAVTDEVLNLLIKAEVLQY